MGGVGSFSRDNKTLYISGLKRTANLEESVTSHFAEWGELTYIKVVWDKSIAFVKFRFRCSAEFAKEAMQDQSLDGDEVLGIRWSNEDPNPTTKEKDEEELYTQLAKKVAEKQQREEPIYNYKNPDPQAPSADTFPSQYYPNQYPDTDQQYSDYNNSLFGWLQQLGLQQYANSFLSAGYGDLTSVAQLDEYTLDVVGVGNLDHRTKLLENAAILAHTYGLDPSSYGSQYLYTNAEYQGLDPNADQGGLYDIGSSHESSKGSDNPLVDYGEISDEE